MTGGVDSRGKRPLILGRSLSYPKYFRSDCTILPLHRRFEEAIVHFIVALDLKAVTQILTDRLTGGCSLRWNCWWGGGADAGRADSEGRPLATFLSFCEL